MNKKTLALLTLLLLAAMPVAAEGTVVVPASEVTGDITDCKLERQLIHMDRSHSLSLTETATYRIYDVCSKQVINEYSVPELTFLGFMVWAILIVGIWLAVIVAAVG